MAFDATVYAEDSDYDDNDYDDADDDEDDAAPMWLIAEPLWLIRTYVRSRTRVAHS